MTNEVRLIDANALKEAFKNQECWNVVIAHIIDNAPTVKPELPKQVNTDFGVMEQPDELSLAFMGEIRTDK